MRESSFSVIVPCFNYARYLRGCVDSILNQGVRVQVIIIDDCSTDETPTVGASLAKDPRVTFIRHETNQGHIKTYNEGLALAHGDYTALVSSDDLLTPGALQRARDVLDNHPSVGFVYGRPIYFENDQLQKARVGKPRVDIWDGRDWIAERCKTATSCISSPEVVVRTSLQKHVGGYREDLPHAGDLEMWLRLAAYGAVAYLGRVDQAYYRRHQANMHRTKFNSTLADLVQRRAAFNTIFDNHAAVIANCNELRRVAKTALAREALWVACRAYDRRRLDVISVDDLEAFALETWAHAKSSKEYKALQWRRRLGPRLPPLLQLVLPSSYIQRAKNVLWWRRWRLRGV